MCFCAHFLSTGQESRLSATMAYGAHLGDVPISRTDSHFFFFSFFFLFFSTSVYAGRPCCRCVLAGVYYFQSDDHLWVLQSSPLCHPIDKWIIKPLLLLTPQPFVTSSLVAAVPTWGRNFSEVCARNLLPDAINIFVCTFCGVCLHPYSNRWHNFHILYQSSCQQLKLLIGEPN